jgi:hypothetical protein
VLDAARHHEELAGLQGHVPVAQLDGQAAVDDQEHLVGVIVLVPDELAHDLD